MSEIETVKVEALDLSQWAYAGFWERFGALVIDFLVLVLALFFIILPISLAVGIGQIVLWPLSGFLMHFEVALAPLFDLKMQILAWLYFAVLESSPAQATLGKRVMGIRVVQENGQRVSFGRATVRYFAKGLSMLIWMIGFIMAAFTSKKQALHDFVAGTVVVKKA